MTEHRIFEAVWTLGSGPLDSQDVVTELFAAIGEMVAIEPARYDLNRRGQWRDYDGRRLIVDVLTQRTQLVTIAEEKAVDQGGTLVALATGKQDQPPQAVLRWSVQWPPSMDQIQDWEHAVKAGFAQLELASIVVRVGDEPGQKPEQGTVRIAVEASQKRIQDLIDAADGSGRPLRSNAIEGRIFFPGAGGKPPQRWRQFFGNN